MGGSLGSGVVIEEELDTLLFLRDVLIWLKCSVVDRIFCFVMAIFFFRFVIINIGFFLRTGVLMYVLVLVFKVLILYFEERNIILMFVIYEFFIWW